MKLRITTLMTIVLCLAATGASAIDYWGGPPPGTWERGDPATTWQVFDYDTFEAPQPAEIVYNPYGTPQGGTAWGTLTWGDWNCPVELDPNGFVTGLRVDSETAILTYNVPNTENFGGAKWMFIQITSSMAPLSISTISWGNAGTYTESVWDTERPQIHWPGPAPDGGDWWTYNYGIVIEPNPQLEQVRVELPIGAVLDQIVIDTICTADVIEAEEGTWSGVKRLYR